MKNYALYRTVADTWHVIEVSDNVMLITFAETVEEAVKQLEELEQEQDNK